MSFPTIPDVHVCGGILREDALKLLMASIAFEELGMAHIINAEAEKIQSVLGTLKGQSIKMPTLGELLRIDNSIGKILEDVIMKEILLQFKLEDVIEAFLAIPPCDPSNPATLPKYVDRVPVPAVLQPKFRHPDETFYEVTMREVRQKLHKCIPETKVWGYEGSYPGPTIEVRRGERVSVRWVNDLPSTHLLPVDKTLHGAEEPPNPEVRTVVHLHDSIAPADSDGHPEAWFTRGFAEVGPNFVHEIYEYPNNQHATTLWYHDHALGITRLNVYAGLAAFYLLRDEVEDSLNIPNGNFEIPLVIQDRSFNSDGSLFYPRQPDPPVTGVDPSVVPEFFGNTILVNGKIWPFIEVEPRKYRFRFLNGSDARFYNLKLESGQSFFQIGTDGGFLERPVEVTELLLAPAERADVILDFTNHKNECILLTNNANVPFPNGDAPDPDTVGQIMQFRVTLPLSGPDTTIIPPFLTTIERLKEEDAVMTRDLTLVEDTDSFGRLLLLLNGLMWDDPVTEKPLLNTIEVWRLINLTVDTHPIHLHLVQFQILDRQPFDVPLFESSGMLVFTDPAIPPDPNENGWKDTVRANPGEVTRIIARFGPFTGDYVWHCHILEHEDHDMMRPYTVEALP